MSRLNALTHGLSATLPLDAAEADAYARSLSIWRNELAPCCEAEDALVRRAAISAVRLDRCALAEEAAITLASKKVDQQLLARRRRAVRKTAQSLAKRPGRTLEALKSTPEGCDWLIARWLEIDATLAHGHGPEPDATARVMNLHGHPGTRPGPDAHPDTIQLWWLLAACQTRDAHINKAINLVAEARRARLPFPDFPPDSEARATLRAHIANQISDLRSLRDAALSSTSDLRDAELLAASASALVDTSPASQLRQRYKREADRSFNQSLSLLLRIRQDRRRSDAADHRASRSSTPFTSPPSIPPRPDTPPTRNELPPAPPASDATPSPTSDLQSEPTPTIPNTPQRTAHEPVTSPAPFPSPDLPLQPHPDAPHPTFDSPPTCP